MLKQEFETHYKKLCSLFGVTYTDLKQRQCHVWFSRLGGEDPDVLSLAIDLTADRSENFPSMAVVRTAIRDTMRERRERHQQTDRIIDEQLHANDKDRVPYEVGSVALKVISEMMGQKYSGEQIAEVVDRVIKGGSPRFADMEPEGRRGQGAGISSR